MNKQPTKTPVPKLRFPGFKGAWEVKPLGEFANFFKGKGISKADITADGEQPCIRYGELYTFYNEIIEDAQSYTNIPTNELVLSKANDVVIPSSGETQEDIATASCVVNSGIALGGDLNIIRSKMNGVFLSYYLNSVKKKSIAQLSQGISVVHLYSSQLKKLDINIPPTLPEQQKIAACLSSVDDLITAQKQKIVALKAHKKGLMQKLFPAYGETVPKLRFPEFLDAGAWEEVSLGSIGKVSMCKRILKDETKPDGDVPFYKIGTFGKKADAYIGRHIYENYKSKFSYPKKGDILISASGTIGRLVVFDGAEAYFQDSNIVWIDNNENLVKNKFLFYCYENIKWVTDDNTIARLYNDNLRCMNILITSILEQQKIADCLTSIDDLITAEAQKLDALKAHKKGLMQQLFPTTV